MSMTSDFLVEIGTEELPPKALKRLASAFAEHVKAGLSDDGLGGNEVRFFATPRRIAVYVKTVKTSQADRVEEKRGPALQAAFKEDGTPTPAAEGFARSCGVSVSDLETLKTDKGAWLNFKRNVKGQDAKALLPGIVTRALDKLPIPKRMRWGTNEHQFVRPVHWVLMLLGKDVISANVMGHSTQRDTRGHRFHCNKNIVVPTPDAYQNLLQSEGHVIADYEQRKATIRAIVQEAALKLGGKVEIDESLLDEVTGLVEWPVAVTGRFDTKYLEVAPEALISAMKGHQKYFHVVDSKGTLLPYFITIANIDSSQPVSVQNGNERVIRPRLSDADFFWRLDKKTPLHGYLPRLGQVVFQTKLGTILDKVKRIETLAELIAERLNADRALAGRAALLAKCDLMTSLVNEFPELQGTIGSYYAQHDKEHAEVVVAIKEHYQPRFAGDATAKTATGQIVAIADKVDTIVGIFLVGEHPSGDKDPFGLRRAALGVLRTIIENKLELDLSWLIDNSVEIFKKQGVKGADTRNIVDFFMERLRSYYGEQNVASDTFDAVHSVYPTSPYDFDLRVKAVERFKVLAAASSLSSANKRIKNIIKKAEAAEIGTIDKALLSEKQEIALANTFQNIAKIVDAQITTKNYTAALEDLAQLKDTVDAFFDKVMVNVEDKKLRGNRLALLNSVYKEFIRIADISKLQVAE